MNVESGSLQSYLSYQYHCPIRNCCCTLVRHAKAPILSDGADESVV